METRDEVAFQAGRKAHRNDEHWGANPYAIVEPREIGLHLDWCDGWHEEQRELADIERAKRSVVSKSVR